MQTENSWISGSEQGDLSERTYVSPAVIRRLPRYFRYLRELIRQGKMRISSGELASMMHVTASQIRQDLNCFGGFGQQGYGYNVQYLYAKICELLGVQMGIQGIIVGAGDLGRALVRSSMFEKRNVEIVSLFDVDPKQIGRVVGNVKVRDMAELEDFCARVPVDMAVLTVPKDQASEVAGQLMRLGITAFWNFTGKELNESEGEGVIMENVHLGDSLMILNYRLCQRALGEKSGKNEKKKQGEGASDRTASRKKDL
ncbi:MAG: redox-sensing transcriptional repressor Rex [Clostridia bacterium]|jgi:redox-sensing transcriptional repressor|nr:redox-sensing transcriptional repressor Rex [Clostridia bacterium]